jgi:predicted RNA-binding protein with PIN domain
METIALMHAQNLIRKLTNTSNYNKIQVWLLFELKYYPSLHAETENAHFNNIFEVIIRLGKCVKSQKNIWF